MCRVHEYNLDGVYIMRSISHADQLHAHEYKSPMQTVRAFDPGLEMIHPGCTTWWRSNEYRSALGEAGLVVRLGWRVAARLQHALLSISTVLPQADRLISFKIDKLTSITSNRSLA
jgi:hypothetical protein